MFAAALALSTALGGGQIAPAAAQQAQGQEVGFDIRAQPLADALIVFGRQAGVQVTAEGALTEGRTGNAVVGALSPAAALGRLLAGTGLTFQFVTSDAVRIEHAPGGSIQLGAVRVEGAAGARGGLGVSDAPYSTPAPTAHISGQAIERFRGANPADMFEGTPGVISAEPRNGGSSVDVNIRGMQGLGRVAVRINGAANLVTIYQGYQGMSNRTFVDPDLLAEIDITKGADVASSGIAGTVQMRTLDADDIVEEGERFGGRVKIGFGTNTSEPPEAGTLAGYEWPSAPWSPQQEPVPGEDGLDRPDVLEPTSDAYSLVGAMKESDFDLIAAYAYRSGGNYHAGENGPSAEPVGTGPLPWCYPSGECPYEWENYYENAGVANYRAGEEILNTEQESESWLAKGTLRFGDGQALQLGYSGFRGEAGDRLASRLNSKRARAEQQEQTAGARLDTGTLRYRWSPADNDLIDLRANAWFTRLEQRNPIRTGSVWSGPSPEELGLPDDYRTGSDTEMWGVDATNESRLVSPHGPVELTYGLSFLHEDTRPSPYTIELEDWLGVRDGYRKDAAGFLKGAWEAADWLTLNAGLRYQYFWSQDRSAPADPDNEYNEEYGQALEDGGLSPSIGVVLEPAGGLQLYAAYSSAIRSPSVMEALTGFSMRHNPALKPERSSNWEAGVNYVAEDLFAEGGRGLLKFGFFDWTVDDYIAREWAQIEYPNLTISALQVYNIHQAHFAGLEASGRYELDGFTADLAASYSLDIEFCKTADTCGNRTLYADYATNHIPPEYTIALTLSQSLFADRITLGGRVSYNGPRAIDHGEVTAQGLSEFISLIEWDEFTLVDAFAEFQLTDGVSANLRVENLTDRFYMDPLSLVQQPGPGRTIYASLSATF